MPRFVGHILTMLLLAAVFAFPARAEVDSGWARTEQVQVRLISAASGAGSAREIRLGLHFQMAPGWKVYWRSPGDAGFPPQLDWQDSRNVANLAIDWPAPHRFEILGFTTFGYKDEVVLPVTLTVQDPGEPVSLVAQLRYMTCDDVCIPYDANLTLDLPEGPTQSTRFAHLITRYANRVPGAGTPLGLSIQTVQVRARGAERFLAVTARAERGFSKPDLIVEGLGRTRLGAPEVTLSDGARRAQMLLPVKSRTDMDSLTGKPLTLTLLDERQSAEFVAAAEPGPPLSVSSGIGWSILLIAFVGGLILNLMPCVLPVLSLKVLSVVGLGGAGRGLVRRKFLATSSGIVASFLALAGVLIGLRAAGASVGWGIQFQEPLFLIAMVVLLTLFAANLWGFFSLRLPAGLGGALASAGEARGRKGLSGDFFTGAFATLLATPCSAPFVGTAVGFALAGGSVNILLIFAVMGVGLATPYLLVALFPALAARLPKPGPWMRKLELVLGVALLGAVVWLLTVLWAQLGTAAYMIGGIALAMLLVFAAANYARRGVAIAAVLAVVLAGAAFAVPSQLRTAGPGTSFVYGDYWVPWRREAIVGHVQAGKVVFVDVTAEWCITCQVNKSLVLDRDDVHERLSADGVVAMVADWTKPDEAISRYLASFGRYGIPFNVVYGPGAPEGIVLPELLTRSAVVSALERASGRPSAERGN